MNRGRAIPDVILDHVVEGRHLVPGTFSDQLGPGPTIVSFLRHFG